MIWGVIGFVVGAVYLAVVIWNARQQHQKWAGYLKYRLSRPI